MSAEPNLTLHLRTRNLRRDATGHNVWDIATSAETLPAAQVALLLCDVWDHHWSRGAEERLEVMIPRMTSRSAASADSPPCRTSWKSAMSCSTSASVGGRRHARKAKVSMISFQHASPPTAGSQTKTMSRPGPSPICTLRTSNEDTMTLLLMFSAAWLTKFVGVTCTTCAPASSTSGCT